LKANRIVTTLTLSVILFMGRCNPHGAQAAPQDDLSGTWKGSMETTTQDVTMELTLTRSGERWFADLTLGIEGHPPSGFRVTDVVVKGNRLTFNVEMHGDIVKFDGDVDGDNLSGTIEGTRHDGARMTAGKWKTARSGYTAHE
jgi:hypothetical protein